jgi:hypothetical protein
MTDQHRGWFVQVVTSIITSLAVLAGTLFAVQGDVVSADSIAEASRLESAFRRIGHLETAMREQQANSNAKIVELTGQVFRLQSQLNRDLDTLDMFENFMDSLPFEAWLKEVTYNKDSEPEFKMLLINKQYEYIYGITRNKYRGLADSEIWGPKISEAFRENALEVLRTKDSLVTYGSYPKDINRASKERMVVRLYLNLVDGREMVFGMAVDLEQQGLIKQ